MSTPAITSRVQPGRSSRCITPFRLIFLQGGKRAPRVAQHQDFVPGTTILPNGKELSVQLSPEALAQGYTTFVRAPERKIADDALYGWFRTAIFGGDDVLSAYGPALAEAAIVVIFLLCFAVPLDFKRGKKMKYGRLLRGPVMSAPKQFNEILKGEGLGIRTDEKGVIIRLPSAGRSQARSGDGRYRRRQNDPADPDAWTDRGPR